MHMQYRKLEIHEYILLFHVSIHISLDFIHIFMSSIYKYLWGFPGGASVL